jgi:hypothetical protein
MGNVTFDEVIEHFKELATDTSLPARLDVLLDLSQMESIPESDQLRSVAGEFDQFESKVEWGTCAIIASSDVLFGMSRIFQVFSEARFTHSNVFRSREEAERWLGSVRSPTG